MKNDFNYSEFFLGANTPYGFFSIFDNLYFPENDWFCHILKGGPGTGKSTLMKKIAKSSSEKKENHEIIRCSSDPKSLDAVILEDKKTCIVDGTAPHIIDPKYPGISDEIINLGECWNKKTLKKSKNEIINLCKENSKYHKTSQKYLAAYRYAFNSNAHIVNESINFEKLDSFCEKLSKKLFKKSQRTKKEPEKLRFITSITPDGYVLLAKTINKLCNKLIIIDDDFSILGSYILKFLRKNAVTTNQSIISCLCPFSPQNHLEALIITDLRIGLLVKNQNEIKNFGDSIEVKSEKIYTKRFLDKNKISKSKNIISFNNKICKEFLTESILNLQKAREVHDKIENIYTHSMNYNKVNKITQKLEGSGVK